MSDKTLKICDNCQEEINENHWIGNLEFTVYNLIEKNTVHVSVNGKVDFCSWGCVTEYVMNQVNRHENGKDEC